MNKTVPARNNVHEFKVHSLHIVLEDTAFIAELLGYSIFSTKQTDQIDIWYCTTKKTNAKAQFRGDKFVILSGSVIDKEHTPSLERDFPNSITERNEIFKKFGRDTGETVELTENVPFKSPNHAGGFASGRRMNAWTTWKNSDGKTMDEVMRRGEA